MCRNFKWSFFQGSQWKNNVNKFNFTFYKAFGKYFVLVPRDFFQNFGVPISRGSLLQLPRWVFLGQYYPLKGPRCIKTPRVFKTIKLFCTDDILQLIKTFLESNRIHQNQNKIVKVSCLKIIIKVIVNFDLKQLNQDLMKLVDSAINDDSPEITLTLYVSPLTTIV